MSPSHSRSRSSRSAAGRARSTATFTFTAPTASISSHARRSSSRDGEENHLTMARTVGYKSPLHQMTQTTPTVLWNDSADVDELKYAIENGAVGATCNPVIALGILKKEIAVWRPRIQDLTREMPRATEDQIGWKLVEELSVRAAKLLEPAFAEHRGRNGRLSVQTDPRLYRDAGAIVEQAVAFDKLAPNMIVKIPATKAGIAAIED